MHMFAVTTPRPPSGDGQLGWVYISHSQKPLGVGEWGVLVWCVSASSARVCVSEAGEEGGLLGRVRLG